MHTDEVRLQWLARRRRYITATDATKILGTSPHGTEWDVWQEKQGNDTELGDIGRRGHELEPLIVEELPLEVVAPWDPMIVRPEPGGPDWAAATVDRLNADGWPVELKTTTKRLGVDAPQHWIDQVLHQCFVTNTPGGLLYAVSAPEWVFDQLRAGHATLRSALSLRVATWYGWEIEAIDYSARADKLRGWHERHVVKGNPPPQADGSAGARSWLASRADERTDEVEADSDIVQQARIYAMCRASQKEHRDEAEACAERARDAAARLLQLMTDRGAKRANGDGVRVTAVDTKGRRSFDRRAFEEAHPDLAEKFTKTGAATVSIRVKIEE